MFTGWTSLITKETGHSEIKYLTNNGGTEYRNNNILPLRTPMLRHTMLVQLFFPLKIPLFMSWVAEISWEYFQAQSIFPMRLTDSISQHTKTMFKKKPCSHIFVSRWAGKIIPRIWIVVQMTGTFSQDMFWLVVTALHADYVRLLQQFATISKHSTLHKVQRFLEGGKRLPYFSIDNAHLMYNAHPKLFRHCFWCIDNAHDAN
jgi:hypothetical protein